MQKTNKIFTNTLFVTLAALLCCALWGSATPFIKIGYELMMPEKDVASTLLFAGVRFTLAGIITILIYSIARRKFLYPKKENVGRVLTVSCFQTVIQYIFFYVGLANTTGVKGTVMSGTNAFFSMLVACLIFRQEKITLKKVTACLLGFAGIVIINLKGLDFNMNFLGDGFVIFASIAYAISSALMKKFSAYEDPVVLSGYQFAAGGAFMAVLGVIIGGNVDFSNPSGVAVLIYLAFLSAIAYSLWGVLLKHNPVSKVTIFSCMISVFGVLLSSLLLDENSGVPLSNLIITLVLICSGIILLNYKKES